MAGIGVAAVTALLATAKAFSDSGDALDKMSQRTGVSVEALSELGYAADLSGTDLETLEAGLRNMQRSLVEAAKGSKGANEALGLLGLTVADLAKLSPDEQFKLLADRISKVQDPALRAALALEVFGKSGTKLLPLMTDGAAGINEMQEQARKLGLPVVRGRPADRARPAHQGPRGLDRLRPGGREVPRLSGRARLVPCAMDRPAREGGLRDPEVQRVRAPSRTRLITQPDAVFRPVLCNGYARADRLVVCPVPAPPEIDPLNSRGYSVLACGPRGASRAGPTEPLAGR